MDRSQFDEAYREYERKMILFEEGPTTTHFEQLKGVGIELPVPDSISDAEMRRKLWEVLAGLARFRAFLDYTDHLSDRELYAKLWNEILRQETPVHNEAGFNAHLDVVSIGGDDEEDKVYLKYFADDKERELWSPEFPEMPPHEEPPFNRDRFLPRPAYEVGPEALEWLGATWNRSAFATNRFGTTRQALEFVQQLYAAGTTNVTVDNILFLPNHDWTPYADTLVVTLPADQSMRRELFELIEQVGRPDEGDDESLIDDGQQSVRLWWD